jgi:predicted phosphodiesterase
MSIKKAIQIINHAVSKKTSLAKACSKFKVSPRYISNLRYSIKSGVVSANEKELLLFNNTYDSYLLSKKLENSINTEFITEELNISTNHGEDIHVRPVDNFDRSITEAVRDGNDKIIEYTYQIFIRDENPLEGVLSRAEMEYIHFNYPYKSSSVVALNFPRLTNSNFKRILRAFNITKDRKFPDHMNEENEPSVLSAIILQNKAQQTYLAEKNDEVPFLEKEIVRLNKKLKELGKLKSFINDAISTYVPSPKISNTEFTQNNGETLFAMFGDMHIGKSTVATVYGRPYNKNIAKERIFQMSNEIIKRCEYVSKLILLSVGDILESILEDGMHPGQTRGMDLRGADQVHFAFDMFTHIIDNILDNTDVIIELYCIGGNHDRIAEHRNGDSERTGSKIIYGFINKHYFNNNRINVIMPDSGIVTIEDEGLCVISHHGDASLAKRKPSELINLFGNGKNKYHIIIQGHFHKLEVDEGTNYLSITLPSMCSPDDFVVNNLGVHSMPGFMIGRKSPKVNSFDFEKITLY